MGQWLNEAGLGELVLALGAFFIAATGFSVAMGYVYERTTTRRIWDVPLKRGQVNKEILGTAVFLGLFVPSIALAFWAGALTVADAGWWAELLTFFVCWYAFQNLYWLLHRAMHHRRLFFTHRWHHESLVTTPWTGLSMSPWETLGWIVCLLGPAMVLSAFGVLGGWGLLVFFAMNWYGNITGHANAEFLPHAFGKRWVTNLTGNVLFHALHHARFDGHYGFGTALQDRVMGTEFADWPKLHAKVWRGEPMESLRERG